MLFRVFYSYVCCRTHLFRRNPVLCFSCSNTRFFCEDFKEKQNLYEILGISRTSNANEIKSAYYKLSFIYHPDKNIGDEDAVRRFQEIRRAYEVLGNNESKQRYDRELTPKSIGDNSSFVNNKEKVEWLDEDYTSFYRKRREGKFKKPLHFTQPEQNYGSYFRAESAASSKYDEIQKKKDSDKINVDMGIIALLLTTGFWFILMAASVISEETKSPESSDKKS